MTEKHQNISELLSRLRKLGIRLQVDKDKLRVDAPVGVLSSSLREELSRHNSEIIQYFENGEFLRTNDLSPIPLLSRNGELEVSFSQERLWFLSQLEPGNEAYHINGGVRLQGRLVVEILQQSLTEIVSRHEALRTTFEEIDGKPVQVISPEAAFNLPVLGLEALPEADRAARLQQIIADEARRPFDLSAGPLFRAVLVRLGQEEHVLVLVMHHIITDGWSLGVFTRELESLYSAFYEGRPSPLADLPVQYADYAAWQRERLQGEVLDTQVKYWRQKLGEELPILQLPTDRPRPAVQTHRGAIESLALPKELTDTLQAMSRREGVALFMTLLAGFKTLLYRLTGQEDTIVGTPIANRNRTEIEGLIGFFVNTLVMRTDLSGQPTFRELLGRVRETALGAYAHQDMPFEKLVEELSPERDLSRTPLFQVFFNHIVAMGDKAAQLPGLEAEAVGGLDRESKFDMTLYVLEGEGGIELRSLYKTDLFDSWRMAQMLKQYEALLKQIVENPDEKILHYSLVTAAVKDRLPDPIELLPAQWEGAIHKRFSEQTHVGPDQVAVVDRVDSWTYGELDCRSNQLAHFLLENSVQPGDVVAIYAHRSASLVWALLGILKAGAAFLLLDPAYPTQRLIAILQAAKPKAWFQIEAAGKLAEELTENIETQMANCHLVLPGLASVVELGLLEDYSDKDPEIVVGPDDLAYVAFTSGTTGEPKGIVGTHGPLSHFLNWHIEKFSFNESDRFSMLSGLSHDPLLRDIFAPLWAGATLCIPEPGKILFPAKLISWMSARQITVAHMTPALSEVFAVGAQEAESNNEILSSIRYIFFGGDVLTRRHVEKIKQIAPSAEFVNYYGATETPQAMGYHVVDARKKGQFTDGIPLGKGVEGVQLLVLNAAGRLAGVGEIAEVHVRTPYLSKGYLNDETLTDAKFIGNPYTNTEDDRIYKTGDLGCYLPDGQVMFHGRSDRQLSLRGFRIELGEIETILSQHPDVRETVVTAREDRQDGKRLVAYFVASQKLIPTTDELRRFLEQRLPDYMVPSAFVSLDALPLMSSGKLNRRALPEPDRMRPDLEVVFIAPRTQTEELVAGIWSNVLGLERIGVYDSFFELGGHSLLVVQIISRIREVFEVELPLRSLFEVPTVARLTERIETARRSDEGLQTYPLQAVSRDQDLPLSFAQQRLWFLHHLEPDSVAYSMPRSIRLKGVLRKDALEKTYVELARRHETLRTTFHSTDGNPVLRIASDPDILFDTVDLRHLPEVEREAEARRLSEEDARKPFDLTRGPLFRIRLLQLEDEEHVLHSNMHHIISDGWSFGVMAREIAALYTAFIKDNPADLPELPVQYADYALWQRQWLQGEALEAQLNYWKDQLGGELPVLELPTDRPRPAVQTHRGAIESFTLSKELIDALQAMSRREGVTLFMTLLAAFKTLLYRLTGQKDTIVGTPIAGRNRTELEGLIGFFINTIVMRTDLSGNPTFRELLGRVRETALGAYAHQDMPFERLVEELAPERDLSRTPLFQVFFNHIVAMGEKAAQLPGIEPEAVGGGLDLESKFDMTLRVLEGEGGIELHSSYNTDLFDSWRMAQMLKQYQMLLESIVSDSDQRISELSLLTESKRHQMLVDWNATQQDYFSEKTLVHLFEEQVERSPDAIAVVYEDQNLTYKKLNSRANQLAHHLSSLGVGPETVVGLCVERSFEMVVGLLGILKAGGAYVPLDPEYPKERLQYMVKDSGADMILTSGRLMEIVKSLGDLSLITLDGDDIFLEGFDDSDKVPTNVVGPGNLAYVIYTSGSTGLPKGTLIEHKSLVNYLCWINTQLMVDGGVRLPLITRLTFDACLKQLFAPLLRGDEVLIFPDDVVAQPARLLQALAANDQIGLNCTPALWKAIIDALSDNPDMLPMDNLSHLFIGGERLSPDLVNRSFATLPHLHIWNLYGPSEVTANSSAARIVFQGDVTIGRPIANTQIYILDPYLQVTPIGVPGELHIGGEALARGYLNRPDLTAERFIPNPFSDKPGARLYKTGDLVRYLSDGNIEFLGRLDNQVKIRGFRIELGEVEATLCLHPSVSEAVVVAREDRPGDKRLVAYVVAAAAESVPSTGVLRAFLQEKLPDYMIPSAFVSMDALPLTANGKVDRRALPAPDRMRPDLEEVFLAPRTQSEELVAGIWSNVLGLERIGVYDSFFELGGHSLLVVQIISRIREVFEVELAVRALFEAPTVAELTERIEAARRSDEGLQTSPLQAVSRDQDLSLSFAQERLWFLHHLEPESVAYSMRRRIRLKGVLRKGALEKTYVELARRHETLRTTFHSTDGHPVLRIAAEPNILFDTVDLRHLPDVEREAEARRLSEEDARKPFDLTRGPLFRVRVFQLEDEEHVLHSNMHHIISDGWSFGVMAREIAALYTAFIKDNPADLPELPVQYADYALWQRQWLQGEALEAQLNYWKDKLGGELPVLELPTDRPRPAVQTHRGAIESFTLSKELTEALQAISRREGVTLFMTLLAAFKTLLYRLTGQKDTIVGTPIAGRNRTELEGLIGFFVNTIVMRTDLTGQPTFRELLGRVRETALGAYAHQDMPFERLVEELAPERDLSRTPLFQVFFNHIVAMGEKAAQLPGIEPEAVGGGLDLESKFDMTLTVLEGEEGLAGAFEYNTDLFDAERIERMVGHFQTLLKGIVADPGKCICDLPIFNDAERRQLLVRWNETVVEYPRDKCIHELFEIQVERTPDAAAVIFGKQRLTYREVNTRANKLAHYLRLQGVIADSRVGIWMDRSLDMMVALLGTLKTGGAYVPLDPSYPQERLAFMLEDAQAPVLLTREKFLEDLPAYAGHVVCMDKDFEAIAGGSEENPISDITADSAAYVIYTSGSTGTPKGVIGLHRGAVNRLSWMWRVYPFKDGEVCCQKTYLSFVDSVWEIFGPLLKGVPTVIIPEEVVKDPHLLVDNLAAAHVSRIVLVPSLLRVLLDSFGDLQKRLFDLKIWVSSGEEISVELAQRFRQVMPEAKLINLYGSSEVSADVSCYEVADGRQHRCLLIGRPIDNTSIYILDSHLQPVPIGVPGELYIGGVGLARGYLNQPDLTAARFIPSPFGQEEVVFKTGDLGRYLPDGNIEYLGRIDHQVKVRGFRIELGEIESRIKGLEAVSNCVVVLREDRPADQRLTAYYVCKDGHALSESEVRRQLQAKLPEYMVPLHFVELSSIPLTPNGKVDRKALPKPEADGSLEQGYVEPRTEAEQKIAAVWQEVLNTEMVGVHDDFFDLGGHSLLATQVMSRINKLFNIQLPLRRLFEAKTIEALAEVIDISLWNSQGLQKSDITGIEKREIIEL